MLNHQRDKLGLLAALPGLTLERLELGEQTTQFELVVNSTEMDDGGIAIALGYARELFAPQTIARMTDHYLAVLQALVSDPDMPLHAVPLLAEDEVAQLHGLSRQRDRFAGEGTLQHRIEARAAANPHAIAITDGDASLDYATLNTRANQLAHYLIATGVGPEQRVGLACRRGMDLIVAMLAVLKAGAAYVPLDLDYPPERLAYIAADSGIVMLLAHSSAAQGLQQLTARTVVFDTLDLSASSAANPQLHCHADNLAYVIYTSGSTGKPKGAQLTHRNVLRLLDGSEDLFHFGPQDVWTLFHSHAFDFSVWEIFGALCCGGRLVLVPFMVSRAPGEFLALLRRERVTVLNQTPSAFAQLMQAPGLYDGAALGLRVVIFGGEALDPETLRPWMDRFGDQMPQLVNMYGITETTVHVTYRLVTRADLGAGSSPIGGALPDLGLHVLDAQLNPVPLGVPGELYVSGAGLARGYLRRAGLTASRFVANPFSMDGERLYRSGDLARWNVQGQLEYLGRVDDQVKIRGFRIELGEIEARLRALPGVGAGLVMADQGPAGARLLAYAVPASGSRLDDAVLKAALAEELPDYMVPAAVTVMPSMPLNANGKIDRKALPRPENTNTHRDGEPPRGEQERMLAQVWSEVLGVKDVFRNDHFFEIGGHSLLAIAMTTRLRTASGIDLPLRKVFEYPLLADMAAQLERFATDCDEPKLIPVPRDVTVPLSPAQRRLWLVDRMAPEAERRAYNMAATLHLDGELDIDVLRGTLQH
ncbi:antibiotic synthetase, putative [Ricinus communis]|uniref:Antibiotic synthetase, putative n=1 Tax=Ricinus communis TaxID=3988 RepID=B9TBD3_RICCO|nr:antibiotic synthetase, putative [Ricinus communis]